MNASQQKRSGCNTAKVLAARFAGSSATSAAPAIGIAKKIVPLVSTGLLRWCCCAPETSGEKPSTHGTITLNKSLGAPERNGLSRKSRLAHRRAPRNTYRACYLYRFHLFIRVTRSKREDVTLLLRFIPYFSFFASSLRPRGITNLFPTPLCAKRTHFLGIG